MKKILIAIATLISIPISFAESIEPTAEACYALSQADMRECLVTKANESQKLLAQTEKDVIKAISKWDEDSKYLFASKSQFAQSSKEFIRYRNAQCTFSASLSGGGAGNSNEILRQICIIKLNNSYHEMLQEAISNISN